MFLDIEKLNAGKFDEGLLSSIRTSKNFILVLTPNALDRCMNDIDKKDWVHRVSMIVILTNRSCSIFLCSANLAFFNHGEFLVHLLSVKYRTQKTPRCMNFVIAN